MRSRDRAPLDLDLLQSRSFDCARRAIARHTATAAQASLLRLPLDGLERDLAAAGDRPAPLGSVRLPLLVYACFRDDVERALPLAAACTLLYLGVDLLDALMDGDPLPHWEGHQPGLIHMAAATMVAALPQRILAGLEAPPTVVASIVAALSDGLMGMSAGQQMDLAGSAAGEWPSVASVSESVTLKTGEMLAMFATMAGHLAGAPTTAVADLKEMGRAWGLASELTADVRDLFASTGKDFASGAKTLPLVLHMEGLKDGSDLRFLWLLEKARDDERARELIRKEIVEAGVLHQCAIVSALSCQQARGAIDRTGPREPAASILRAMIEAASLSGGGGDQP